MRHSLLILLLVGGWLAVIVNVDSARADGSADYIQQSDGYYYRDGVAYRREKVYLSDNGYGQRTYYWKYTVANIVPPYKPGWRTIHSATLAAIAKGEESNKALAIDSAAYVQSAEVIRKALGTQYSAGYNLFSQGYSFPQGSTVYAQTPGYNTVNASANAGVYTTPIDLNVHLQAYNRLAERALTGGQELAKGSGEIGLAIADNAARLEAMRTSTASVTTASGVRASASTGSNPTATYQAGPTVAGPAGDGGYTGVLPSIRDGQLVVNARCISCHSAATPKGNLNLSNITTLSDEQWEKVILRTSPLQDPKVRMPKDAPALPHDENLKLRAAR